MCLNGWKAVHASTFRPLALNLHRRGGGHGVARQRRGAGGPSRRPVGGIARVGFTSIAAVSAIVQGSWHSAATLARHADHAQGRIDALLRRVVHRTGDSPRCSAPIHRRTGPHRHTVSRPLHRLGKLWLQRRAGSFRSRRQGDGRLRRARGVAQARPSAVPAPLRSLDDGRACGVRRRRRWGTSRAPCRSSACAC